MKSCKKSFSLLSIVISFILVFISVASNLSFASVIDIPEISVTNIDINAITVEWTEVSAVTGYEIEVDGVLIDSGLNTTYEHTGLELGTTHTYRVRAKNETEISDWSNLITESTKDLESPTIILNSSSDMNLEVGIAYTEEGATANDNVDGDITSNIVTTGSVDTNVLGDYTVTYEVSDSAGNTATATRTIHVVDTTKPVITLNGNATVDINIGETYTEEGATATDNYDGDITANIVMEGTVDNTTEGIYQVTYNVTDSSNNIADEVSRTINVVTPTLEDIISPEITITGNQDITLEVGTAYTEEGATANDNIDGDITSNIVTTGSVDTNVIGDYTVTYEVSDSAGNTATATRTIHVVDTTKPDITLNGNATVELNIGETYTEEGATATDNYDGDITANIVIEGIVDTLTAGTYQVTYNVTDSSGNVADEVVRTVNVINPMANILLQDTVPLGWIGIYSEEDLNNVKNDLAGKYILMNNINLLNYGNWQPIINFAGTVDGNGAKISNLTIVATSNNQGLFGNTTTSAVIKNVKLENVSISNPTSIHNGGLVGTNYGTIQNSYVIGNVEGLDGNGILVGYNYGDIIRSYTKGKVIGHGYNTGGLVGCNFGSTSLIEDSYSTATVEGNIRNGGLAGYNQDGVISSSYSTGNVSGSSINGGLVGANSGTITNSYWDKIESNQLTSGGGIGKNTRGLMQESSFGNWDFTTIWTISENSSYPYLNWQTENIPTKSYEDIIDGDGTSTDPYIISTGKGVYDIRYELDAYYKLGQDIDLISYSNWDTITDFEGTVDGNGFKISNLTINIIGTSNNQGLFGITKASAIVKNIKLDNVNICNLDTIHNGGLVGTNYGTIQNSYVIGNVEGNDGSGLLVGYNYGDIIRSYTKGNVIGHGYNTGGLVGCNFGSTSLIEDSYSTATVEGDIRNGGLAGYNQDGVISRSYSTGNVSGSSINGGLVGANSGTITNSYWDKIESNQMTSGGGIGKNTRGLMQESTFGNWDFTNIWTISENSSYPYLNWQTENIPNKSYEDIIDGDGTSTDPYIISTGKGVYDIRYELDACYKLGQDIDLISYSNWNSITDFEGTIDGNGFKISNLTINIIGTSNNQGLFGITKASAIVKNIKLDNVNICNLDTIHNGGLVGTNYGTIQNSYVIGNVEGNDGSGLLVGYNYGDIIQSYTKGKVIGHGDNTGGLVGCNFGSTSLIEDSYSTATVEGDIRNGGLVGYNQGGVISNSYSIGNVSGSSINGGLVGTNSGAVNYSYWDIETSNQITSAGGTGKTTNEMKEQLTFENWDFTNNWRIYLGINEGYPYLQAFNSSDPSSDTIQPIITLNGDGEIILNIGNDYVEEGATAIDNIDGDISDSIVITGTVDTTTVGTYYIQYNVVDSNGNVAQEIVRTVNVVLETPTNITTTPSESSITIAWDSVNGATGYDIEVDGIVIDNGVDITYTHSNLELGTSHSYRVRAKNQMANSDWSDIVTEIVSTVDKGTGTIDDPFIIITKEDLIAIKDNLSAYYKLTNDIDLSNEEWQPIGNSVDKFTGSLDGNGYKISNITINSPLTDYMGLFGYVENANIKNLELENVNITGHSYIGGLIGRGDGENTIEGIKIAGTSTIKGYERVGGLVGQIDKGQIDKSYSKANVETTYHYAGGLIGYNYGASIRRSCTEGNVSSGSYYSGGLVGYIGNIAVTDQVIENSYALGEISGTKAGGLVGGIYPRSASYAVDIRNCYSVGSVTVDSTNGGLIGYNGSGRGIIINSYYDGVASRYEPRDEDDISRQTTAMKRAVNYEGWDFTGVWDIDEGNSYPKLRELPVPTGVTEGLPVNEVAGGTGTIEDPYIVRTKEQLNNVRFEPTANYKLESDIDLINEEWAPIGNSGKKFTGSLDGNGYKISNITINSPSTDYMGLFGYVENASIKNLELENVNITGHSYIGGLIGRGDGENTIEGIKIAGTSTIKGYERVGGLVGQIDKGQIDKSYSKANVETTYHYAGGLIGYNYGASIRRSCTEGNVSSGSYYSGGIVGYIGNIAVTEQVIENSYALGEISGTKAGGLLGGIYPRSTSYAVDIRNCYSAGSVTIDSTNGGLIGYNGSGRGIIINSYYDGSASRYEPRTQDDISRQTTAMKKASNYETWDFTNIWDIDEGNSYPKLRELPVPTGVTEGLPVNEVAGGTGTIEDPYIVRTKEQLNNVRFEPTAHYKLESDIDLINEDWASIGNSGKKFTGSLDGNGYKISNIIINSPSTDYMGLFGYVENASIKNLELENVNITGHNYIGGLIGQGDGENIIEGIKITGTSTIKGYERVGGLVGQIDKGQIDKSYSKANVETTYHYAGGLIGYNYGASIRRSCTEGNVSSGSYYSGGIVGYIGNIAVTDQVIENSYALGEIRGTKAGGLLGGIYPRSTSYAVDIRNCYSAGSVTVDSTNGGLIGYNGSGRGIIINSYYDGVASRYEPRTQDDISRQTTAMKRAVNYEGWDFTGVWNIDEGISYPYLRELPVPTGVTEGLPVNEVAGGIGTIEDPYIVRTKEQFNNVRFEPTAYYKLESDIDLINEDWASIGNSGKKFTGSLDGNGYKISNITINSPSTDYMGLFGYVENASIKNLELENVNITGHSYIGGLIGRGDGENTIEGIKITGTSTIKGYERVGGLVGQIDKGQIDKSYSKANVETTYHYAGGLIGYNYGASIRRSCTEGNVSSGSYYSGGLVGYIGNIAVTDQVIENSYALGEISGTKAGGLLGGIYPRSTSYAVDIINCYSAGSVTIDSTNGGLIGYNISGNIINSYFDSTTTGFTTPTEQARTTEELMNSLTFSGWDFENVWDIEEGITYPFIKLVEIPKGFLVNELTYNNIGLIWNPVEGATSYQIEVDNNLLSDQVALTYIHENLTPGTLHGYRIRAKEDGFTSEWSEKLVEITLLQIPQNVTSVATENEITITWDSVVNAIAYEIEIDGQVVDSVQGTSYIHDNLNPNTQHSYRVRAKNDITKSEWSNLTESIYWSQNVQAVCLAIENWVKDIQTNNEMEIRLRGRNIVDLYTIEIELGYNPNDIAINQTTVNELIGIEGEEVYNSSAVETSQGKLKILISKTKDIVGKNGEFDILSFKLNLNSENLTEIQINSINLVDSNGEDIIIFPISALKIKELSEEQRIY